MRVPSSSDSSICRASPRKAGDPSDSLARPAGRVGSRANGFTLVELLTVVGIVAVLASLIFPALGKARILARSGLCLHQLRQWGVAVHLYAADHEDLLPPEGAPNPTDSQTNVGWYIQLPRQLGLARYHDQPWRTNPASPNPGRSSLWLCPANPRRSNGRNLFHYCFNQHLDGTGDDDTAVRLSALSAPSGLVGLFDSKNLPAVGSANFTHTNLHAGGAQFLFLDGHVRRLPAAAYWDESRDRPRTNPAALRWFP